MKLEGSISHLQAFNALVLAYQDEAYTLACYLLSDEAQAGEVVQDACRETYWASRDQQTIIRNDLLRRVVRSCLALSGRTNGTHAALDTSGSPLALLPMDQRALVVLVDVLGLDYHEAAGILRKSTSFVRQKLARGRASLASQPG